MDGVGQTPAPEATETVGKEGLLSVKAKIERTGVAVVIMFAQGDVVRVGSREPLSPDTEEIGQSCDVERCGHNSLRVAWPGPSSVHGLAKFLRADTPVLAGAKRARKRASVLRQQCAKRELHM